MQRNVCCNRNFTLEKEGFMGCGNEISNWDNKAVQDSLSGKNTTPTPKITEHLDTAKIAAARNAINSALKYRVNDLKTVLANPGDSTHKAVQGLLEKALSHGQLASADEAKLAPALKTVLDIQQDPQGLFEKPPTYRGPGSSAMQHGGELLTAAAIIQKGSIPTSLGNSLTITQSDSVAFGQKIAAKYAFSTATVDTIEADTLINRSGKYIGIDTKYSKTSSTYSATDGLERQLNGIKNGYRSGELHEFYFVSNVRFSPQFKEMVENHNIQVFRDRLNEDTSLRNNFGSYLTKEEKKGYIPEKYEEYDFKRDKGALREATKAYEVPQTGLCEGVNYDRG